jgi:hypothetical protein
MNKTLRVTISAHFEDCEHENCQTIESSRVIKLVHERGGFVPCFEYQISDAESQSAECRWQILNQAKNHESRCFSRSDNITIISQHPSTPFALHFSIFNRNHILHLFSGVFELVLIFLSSLAVINCICATHELKCIGVRE